MICDFCSDPSPAFEYPTPDSALQSSSSFVFQSFGSWAACPTCHALIEQHDRDGLFARSVGTMFGMPLRHPGLLADIRALHNLFFDLHRPPRPIQAFPATTPAAAA